MAKYITLDGLSIFLGKLKDGSCKATHTEFGAIKVVGNRSSSITTVGTSNDAGRSYGIELDSNGKAFVNVPWTSGLTEIPTASNTAIGGIKVVNNRSSSITTVGTSDTANRYYGIELDSNGKAFVNVPWTGGLTEIPTASKTAIGGIKVVGSRLSSITTVGTSNDTGRSYGIELDSNGKAFVNVPWTNTTYSNATQSAAGLMSSTDKAKLDGIANNANNYTYTLPTASSSALGGIKIGYTQSGKNYPVQLDANNKAYVNVPWTDANNYTLPTTTNSNAAPTISALTADYITELTSTALTNIAINGFETASTSRLTTYGLIFNATASTKFTWPSGVMWANGKAPCIRGGNIGEGLYEIIFTYTPNIKKYTATWAKYS